MLFTIEIAEEWLQTIDVLTETLLHESAPTPKEALVKAVFCQIQYQYPKLQGGCSMSKQPEITFRHGTCSASVFENEYERGEEKFTVRTVAFQRRYLDKDGNWNSTSTLRVNDIPKAVLVLQRAYEFLTANGDCQHEKED